MGGVGPPGGVGGMERGEFIDPVTGTRKPERRSGVDRRDAPSLGVLLRTRPRRRRSRGRRATDRGGYVDIYDSRTWGIALSVCALSLADALLTRMHLLRGSAEEWNPLMKAVISEAGMPAFFALKLAMTVIPMALILVHKEWVLGRYAARLCLWAYILLSCYHVYLLFAAAPGGSA